MLLWNGCCISCSPAARFACIVSAASDLHARLVELVVRTSSFISLCWRLLQVKVHGQPAVVGISVCQFVGCSQLSTLLYVRLLHEC
jgi:hypothetical protein